ncbi:hypothetical protein ACHAC9_24045, partial [Massilia sp. CMS3.1]|uniref:hypothetical protein n=1 Tax=Massilia sp. CMS3.1 TaxID=3373083 RepID=UPI003EE5D87D
MIARYDAALSAATWRNRSPADCESVVIVFGEQVDQSTTIVPACVKVNAGRVDGKKPAQIAERVFS